MRPPFAFPEGWAEMRRLLCRDGLQMEPPFAAPPFAHPSALRPNASPAFSVNRPWPIDLHAGAKPTMLSYLHLAIARAEVHCGKEVRVAGRSRGKRDQLRQAVRPGICLHGRG